MTRFYKRAARLTIWKPRPDATSAIGSLTNALHPNAVQIERLRIRFAVSKSVGSDPNTCEIVVSNLAEKTRAEIADLPRKVILEVGYEGAMQRLFVGDLRWANSVKVETDWETTLQVADGGRAFIEPRVGRSWSAGTTAITAIRECVEKMGFLLPRNAELDPRLRRQFANGIAIAGRASIELSRLLAPFGLGWSVQDGNLQILAADEIRADQALVIDGASGMIGAPSFAPPATAGAKPVLTVQTLIYPQVTPGGRIDLRSQQISGRFKVTSVNHSGDTHGDDWTTEIEGTAA